MDVEKAPDAEAHYMSVKSADLIVPDREDAEEFDLGKVLLDALTPRKQVVPNLLVNQRPTHRLSEEERDARRALKRHKRRRTAQARTARSTGSRKWIEKAKATGKRARRFKAANPEITDGQARQVARLANKIESELVGMLEANAIGTAVVPVKGWRAHGK